MLTSTNLTIQSKLLGYKNNNTVRELQNVHTSTIKALPHFARYYMFQLKTVQNQYTVQCSKN